MRGYKRSWLRFDIIAGVVLAAILVPQGMAYAELAGLPPVNGLYTTIAVLVGYALLGPSRILVLGPDASVAPMIAVAITPLLVTDDPAEAVALAGMLALMVGAIQVGLGLGKLGFVADLLSKEVQVGYMNGLAVTIIVGQLPKLFGFSTDADGFFEEIRAFLEGLDQTNTTALAIGLATLAVLLLLPRVTKKVPAVLVAVLGATVVTGVLDLAAKGVDVVGPLPQGLPSLTFPSVPLESLGPLLAASFGIVLVSLTDQIATSASFAARQGENVDANQEMVGMGGSNIVAGMFQGFAVSASGSRTAVAEQSGAKSQATGLVGAGVVALMLLLFPTLLQNLPQPALAAVVIVAALSLFDGPILGTYYRMRKSAFVIATITSLGVILFGVLEGILIAVVLSILLFFKKSWWPEGEVLGEVEDLGGWHSTSRYPDAEQMDDVVVYRWDAPLFFANAGIFRQEMLTLVNSRQPRWVVLQCEAITDIDVTAADMLEQMDTQLNTRGINIVFAEMHGNVQDTLERYGLFATLDREHVYPSMDLAMRGIEHEAGAAPADRPYGPDLPSWRSIAGEAPTARPGSQRTGAGRQTPRGRLGPSGCHGLRERGMVALVLVGVGLREVRDRLVELGRVAQVGRDGHPVPGAGVRPRQGPGAQPGVVRHALRDHQLDRERELPVTQLPQVEVVVDPVDVGHPVPAQEDVAGGLHQELAGHHALPVVGVLAGPAVVRQDRGLGLLGLQEQRLDAVAGLQEQRVGSRAHAAHPDHLARHVLELELLEEVPAIGLQGLAVPAQHQTKAVLQDRGVDFGEQLTERDDQRRAVDEPPLAVDDLGQLAQGLHAVARVRLGQQLLAPPAHPPWASCP